MAHYIRQNDRRPYIRRRLKDADGEYVDLTAAAVSGVTFTMAPHDDRDTPKVNNQAAQIGYAGQDGSGGHVEYQWQAGDTDTVGTFDAEWVVSFTDGTTETFPGDGYDRVIVFDDLA